MRFVRFAAVVLPSLVVTGCPAMREPNADAGGADAPIVMPDAAPPEDGPSELDARIADAPALDSAPVGDAPSLDGGTDLDAASDCDGLAPASCLAAGCDPVFDDACCPTCTAGGCADCTNIGYHACTAPAVSPCSTLDSCGVAPAWACAPGLPACASANVVDVDSCTVAGCVPAYPSGTGAPDTSTATCVGIVAESCTVACRRLAPPCPDGTTAEGDGNCYTNRCIPSFVCGR